MLTSSVTTASALSEPAALRALRELGANIRAKVAAQVQKAYSPATCAVSPLGEAVVKDRVLTWRFHRLCTVLRCKLVKESLRTVPHPGSISCVGCRSALLIRPEP